MGTWPTSHLVTDMLSIDKIGSAAQVGEDGKGSSTLSTPIHVLHPTQLPATTVCTSQHRGLSVQEDCACKSSCALHYVCVFTIIEGPEDCAGVFADSI